MGTQWADEIERSFGDGPPPPPPAAYVATGRAAVRRRRLAFGTASLAVVAMVGGFGWAALPGDDPRAVPSRIATDPTPVASVSPGPTAAPTVAPLARRPEDVRAAEPAGPAEIADVGTHAMMPVTALADGGLRRRADWDVQAIYVLLDRGERKRVWGVSAVPSAGGEAVWMLISWRPGTVGALSDPEGKRFATFEDWLDQTWAEQQGLDEPPTAWTVDGRLEVAPDVGVLETRAHPEQAAAYGPVDQQVAAKVRLRDGTIVFLLAGPDDVTTVDPSVLSAPTMDAFLAHLEAQAASGEGLR